MNGEQMFGGFIGVVLFIAGMLTCLVAMRATLPLWAKTAVEKERKKKRVYEHIGPDYRVLVRARVDSYALRADGAEAKISITDSTKDTVVLLIKVPDTVISKFPAGTDVHFEMVVSK